MTTAEAQSKLRRFLRILAQTFKDTNLFFSASALTFNIFICAVPLSLLALSVLGIVLSNDQINEVISRIALEFFPKMFADSAWIEKILAPLRQHSGLLGMVGFGTMVVTAQGLFGVAKQTLFHVFKITERRHPMFELFQNFVTIGIIGAVFLSFSGVFSLSSILLNRSFILPVLEIELNTFGWYELATQLLAILFTLTLFFLLFRYLSEKRLCRRASFVGGLTYTVLFELSKWMFTAYVGFALSTYQSLYQGYTFVVVTGFWGFYSAVIFVVAAIVSKSYQDTFLIPDWAGNPDSETGQ